MLITSLPLMSATIMPAASAMEREQRLISPSWLDPSLQMS
jgi:hypothetical protein